MKRSIDFSLIELMVVIAIIAILEAIALSAQRSLPRLIADGFGTEIRYVEIPIKLADHESRSPLEDSAFLGLNLSPRCLVLTATLEAAGVGKIECTVAGRQKVNGKTITLIAVPAAFGPATQAPLIR